MQDYSFAADLLATFRASPDFIKALLVLVPPLFTLALLKLLLLRRVRRSRCVTVFGKPIAPVGSGQMVPLRVIDALAEREAEPMEPRGKRQIPIDIS